MDTVMRENGLHLRKFILVLLFAIYTLSAVSLFAHNSDYQGLRERYFSNATIDDTFEDNMIIVTLSEEASFLFREWTIADFPELDLYDIENLSSGATEIVSLQIHNEYLELSLVEDRIIKHEAFRKILALRLQRNCKQNVLDSIQLLQHRSDIESATPSFGITMPEVSHDYFDLNAFTNQGNYQPWNLHGEYGINASGAWEFTKGSSDIRVGIIDSGINANHNLLKDRVDIASSRDFAISSNSGYIVEDNYGHGTWVAGIIALVAPNVTLVSLRIAQLFTPSQVFDRNLHLAIDHATRTHNPVFNYEPIHILNFSGVTYGDNVQNIRLAIMLFPGVFITAVDNAEVDHDDVLIFPANYSRCQKYFNGMDKVISVSSINSSGQRPYRRAWGQTSVSIFAPGEDIYTTNIGSEDAMINRSGTSYATPHVAGVAALMLSINPNLGPEQVKSIILGNSDSHIISTPDGYQTVRRLNAFRSVMAARDLSSMLYFVPLSNNTVGVRVRNGVQLSGIVPIPLSANIAGSHRTVTQIMTNGFANQAAITEIHIPRTIVNIGHNAFVGTNNLRKINVDAFNQHYRSHAGMLFNHERTRLIHVPQAISGPIVIPSTTNHVPFDAFADRQNITEINLNPYIANLSHVSFANMPNLARINVSGVVAPYFSTDGILVRRSAPQTIVHVPYAISGHIRLSNWLDEIPDLAFENRGGITAITFLSTNPPTINNLTFAGLDKSNIRLYVLPSMTTIFMNRGWGGFNIIDQGITEIRLTEISYMHPNATDGMAVLPRPTGTQFEGQITWVVTGDVNFNTSGNHNEIITITPLSLGTVRVEAHYMGMMAFVNIRIIPPHKCNCNLPWCLDCMRDIWWEDDPEPFVLKNEEYEWDSSK